MTEPSKGGADSERACPRDDTAGSPGAAAEGRVPARQTRVLTTEVSAGRSGARVQIDPEPDGGDEGYQLARIWDPGGNRLHLYRPIGPMHQARLHV